MTGSARASIEYGGAAQKQHLNDLLSAINNCPENDELSKDTRVYQILYGIPVKYFYGITFTVYP